MFRNFLKKNKSAIVFLGDVSIFILSLALTIYIRYGRSLLPYTFHMHVRPFAILITIWIFVFYAIDLYSYPSWKISTQNIRKFIIGSLINFFSSISIFYIFGEFFKVAPKSNLIIFAILFFVLDSTWRICIAKILASRNNNKTIAIFSSSKLVEDIVNHCTQHPQLGYSVEIHTNIETIKSTILEHKDKIIIVVDNTYIKDTGTAKTLYELLASHVEIATLAEFYEELLGCIPLSEIKEEWFIQEIKSDKSFYESIKRIIDVTLIIFVTIFLSPFFVMLFVLIPLTSKGPAIYKQKRVGRDDKIFTLYKFRSMHKNAEKDGAVWAQSNDLRTTKIGNILRKTHFDELPQVLNILKGDMSLVGPRPERPEFVTSLKNDIPHYFMRQTITPGLTGWAQIMFRYANTVDEQKEKFKYDLYYIKNRNTWLDLGVIVKTIKLIFSK